MSIMDLYREICMERFGLDESAQPVANEDTEEPSKKVKKKKKKEEPSALKSLVKKRSLSVDCVEPLTKKCKVVKVAKCNASQKMTGDGFKIVSEMDLPSDDSDISDAFESDEDDIDTKMKLVESKTVDKSLKIKIALKQTKLLQCKSADLLQATSVDAKFTDDGFRIVSYIPDDDSDISDAFDSEGSDCEGDTDGKPLVANVTAGTSSSNKSRKEYGVIKTDEKSVVDETIVDGKNSEGELKTKKRKRGPRNNNNNKSCTGLGTKLNSSKTIPQSKKKDKDKKNRKPKKEKVQLTKDDIEAIKAKIPPKIQKIIIEFGLDWAKFDTPADREKRDLATLPQPEQIPNCTTYLKKDPISGKIITVYDYSKKRGGAGASKAGALNAPKSGSQTAAAASSGMKQAGVVSKTSAAGVSRANKNAKAGDVPLTEEQLELIEKRKQMKAEHLDELRAIKRNIVTNVINKSLDPRTKDQKRLALIEKLGGVVKKPFVNYKVLMANKKKEKQEAEVARENFKNLGMHDLLKKKRRQHRKKDPNEVSGFNSLGGRIRDGVMVIGKKDIARLNA